MEMTTDQHALFLGAMTSLSHVQQSVADLFFKNRLSKEVEFMLKAYISKGNTSHPETVREYVCSLKAVSKMLEEIMYLEKADVLIVALAREQVLRCLHASLISMNTLKEKFPEVAIQEKSSEGVEASIKIFTPVVPLPRRDKKALTETQEKILEFVRRTPDRRAKEVLSEFSALSQRTVKRGLKELSEEGRIVKRVEEDGAVYYSAA